MSVTVTAAVHHRRRRLGIATGAALLTLAVSGCSGLGRTAVGPVTYTTERDGEVSDNSPSVKGCHRLASGGTKEIINRTLIDMIMYRTPDCSGKGTAYVPTTFSDVDAKEMPPWRSYTFVH